MAQDLRTGRADVSHVAVRPKLGRLRNIDTLSDEGEATGSPCRVSAKTRRLRISTRAVASLRSFARAVPARRRHAKLNTRVERLPDAQQEIQLEPRLLRPERRVCLDLDHVALHPLNLTLASSEEVGQFVRQRGLAELNAQAPQPCS